MLARLAGLDILPYVHPALRWGEREAARAAIIPELPVADWRLASPLEPDALYFALMLGAASPVEVTGALARLNTNGVVSRAVIEGIHLRVAWTRPSEAVAILGELSELGVVVAYVLHEGARAALNDYLARWRFVRAETIGDDLIARGLTPGPQFKRLLWELRAARLDGVITDIAGERELIQRWLTETKL
jgi:tRNA nucleotidyltransferase (CCA-adding enzyme)